jgi:hypothetical protein
MGKKEAIGRGVDAHEFYEKNPEELTAGNRYRVQHDQNPITMNIPKDKKKVPMENVSKTATRIFGVPTTAGKPKMVVPGSKKANKLQAKSDWSDSYEKKANAKFDARMKKMKG